MLKTVGFRKNELVSISIAGSAPLKEKVVKAIQVVTKGLGLVSTRRSPIGEGMSA
jgi:hypothetical protein